MKIQLPSIRGIMKRLTPKAAENKGPGSYYDKFRSWFEPHNIFDRLRSGTLATNETIFSAVTRLSNSLATLPIKLYDDKYNVVSTSTSRLLAYSPNPNMTGFQFFRTLEASRCTDGNGYAIKDYDQNYQPRALWVLEPGKVVPVIEATTRELWYQIQGDKYTGVGQEGLYYVHNMDMIHVSQVYTIGYKGISPLDVLTNTVDFDAKIKSFSLDQIDTAIKASFILKLTGANVSEEKKATILAAFREFYKENGGVLLQEAGTEIDPIQQKEFIDPQLLTSERITRTRVASVFNMPAYMLGETEGVTYNSMEQMSLEYAVYTQTPICKQYEAELDRKLTTIDEQKVGRHYKFNIAALLRADAKTRGEYYTKGIRSGWMTPNEVRALEEQPAAVGGNQLFISGDLYPITQERIKK